MLLDTSYTTDIRLNQSFISSRIMRVIQNRRLPFSLGSGLALLIVGILGLGTLITFQQIQDNQRKNTNSFAATYNPTTRTFTETFDGAPGSPQPFTQIGQNTWDVAIHSRNPDTWDQMVGYNMMHGPNCEPPLISGATAPHHASDLVTHAWDGNYEGAVFKCNDHVMTGVNGVGRSVHDGYALAVLTPNAMVDFTNGPAVIKFNVTTYRTTPRDFIDVWITPWSDNLQLPFDTITFGNGVDLQGAPRNAVQVTLFAPNDNNKSGFKPNIFKNGVETGEFRQFTSDYDSFLAYEDYLPGGAGDPKRRDTFEITISKTHIKVCMPQDLSDNAPSQTICWTDKNINPLPFTTGIVQFAHHSYTPDKDCQFYQLDCGPNTWHWDDISISPAIPFTMIKPNVRTVRNENTPVVFNQPAPANSYLRFSAAGSVQISLNNGAYQSVSKQPSTGTSDPNGHVASYFVPVPAGTQNVRFKMTDIGAGGVRANDFAIWSMDTINGTPIPTNTPTRSTSVATDTPTMTLTPTPTPTPTLSPTKTPTPTLTPTWTPTPTVTVTPTFTVTPTLTQAPGKPGDLNNDGQINVFDMSILLSNFGSSNVVADINRDGRVNVFDLSILLSNFGK